MSTTVIATGTSRSFNPIDVSRRMSDTSLYQVGVSVTVKKNGSANMPRGVTVASSTKTLYEAFAEMYV